MIKIIKAEYQYSYIIRLFFSDGLAGDYDLSNLIARNTIMTQPLTSNDFFKNFFIELGALCWRNGFELSAGSIYRQLQETNQLFRAEVAA